MKSYLLSNSFLIPAVKVLLVLLVSTLLNFFLRSLIKIPHSLETRKSKTYAIVVRNLITLLIFLASLHVIFIILGINIAPLLASAGIIGIVIGIGSRSLFEDLIAGFIMLTQSKVAIGDYVKLNPNIEGTVKSMGFKNLELIGPDGSLIIVPNGQINILINTTNNKAISTIDISVKADQDIDKVIKVCKETLSALEKSERFQIFKGSEVFGIASFQGPSVIIRVIIHTKSADKLNVEKDYHYKLLKALNKQKLQLG